MEPDDSISVFITAEKIPGWGNKIIVSGSDGDAHNYMVQDTNTLSAEVHGTSDTSFQEFYMAADHYIDSLTKPLNALLQNHQVTRPVYDLYTADIKSKLYSEVLAELSHILHKDKRPSAEKVGLFLNFKDLVFYK